MMTVAVQRLNEGARAALLAHFLALPVEDRRLRFGSSLSPEGIAAYVDEIDFDRDAVFGVQDDRLALVGVAHVAFGDDLAELGLSVLPEHRGHGVGGALFERAAAHARNRFIPRLFMHCLTENAPIMRMARRFGMDIVTDAGDADAHLELPPASPASITGEFVTDRFALYDHALKAHAAAWKRPMSHRKVQRLRQGPIRPVRRSVAREGATPLQPRPTPTIELAGQRRWQAIDVADPWQRARREEGLQGVRIHDLRHTFGCRLRAAGVPVEDREVLLGHANHSMAGHYASADVGRLLKQANLVLNREETRTVLRIANADARALCTKGPAAVRQEQKGPRLRLVTL